MQEIGSIFFSYWAEFIVHCWKKHNQYNTDYFIFLFIDFIVWIQNTHGKCEKNADRCCSTEMPIVYEATFLQLATRKISTHAHRLLLLRYACRDA